MLGEMLRGLAGKAKTAQPCGFTAIEWLDRTQEVAGSSPASSIPDLQGFFEAAREGRLSLATHMQPGRSRADPDEASRIMGIGA
jgi:hypothetical protein